MKDYELPPEIEENHIPNAYKPDKYQQERPPKPPIRAIALKGQQLRAAVRRGNPLDWADIHERYVDLWEEARHAIWRAKHSKQGVKQWDPVLQKTVQTFIVDEKLVHSAIDTTKGVLDSIVRLRKEIGNDASGIPHWAIERIENALRDYPQALNQLLTALVAPPDEPPGEIE